MRLFIAFPISLEVKKQLEQIQISLYKMNQSARVRWTSAGGWHVTVVFLGDVETQNFTSLQNAIENICKKYKPINFKLEKVDGFPDIHNPNVIVVKAIDENGRASQMQKDLSDALRQLGIQTDNKPWKPHITIGRNKFGEQVRGLDKISLKPIEWTVNEVILFESELLASGPRYTKLFSCNL